MAVWECCVVTCFSGEVFAVQGRRIRRVTSLTMNWEATTLETKRLCLSRICEAAHLSFIRIFFSCWYLCSVFDRFRCAVLAGAILHFQLGAFFQFLARRLTSVWGEGFPIQIQEISPTVGYSVEQVQMDKCKLTVVDLSGQLKYAKLWECYYEDAQVDPIQDASAFARWKECACFLYACLSHTAKYG